MKIFLKKTLKNYIKSKNKYFNLKKLIYIYIKFIIFDNNIFYLNKKNINFVSIYLLLRCIIYYFTIILWIYCSSIGTKLDFLTLKYVFSKSFWNNCLRWSWAAFFIFLFFKTKIYILIFFKSKKLEVVKITS